MPLATPLPMYFCLTSQPTFPIKDQVVNILGGSIAHVFGFFYLSCLWLCLKISSFHPPPPQPEVLPIALIVPACASGVTGDLLLPVSLLWLASPHGAQEWWVPLLCLGFPGSWAPPPQEKGGGKPGSQPLPCLGLSSSRAPPLSGGTRVTGPSATRGTRVAGSVPLLPSSLWPQL